MLLSTNELMLCPRQGRCLLVVLCSVFFVIGGSAFQRSSIQGRDRRRTTAFRGNPFLQHIGRAPPCRLLPGVVQMAANGETHSVGDKLSNNGSDDNDSSSSSSSSDNLLASAASRLSHVMLQVPSVDATVAYWKDTAKGQVTASSKLDKNSSDDELRSAFVVLGNGKTLEDCFALELVKNRQKSFQLGNMISYLGVSKLVQYSSPEDLIGVITGEKKKGTDQQDEPNGIPVQSCASAPGDYLARLCLHTTNLSATADFYTDILGMAVAAADDNGAMLCLRYQKADKSSFYGVPTTLVFEPLPDTVLDKGNCFDHLVIATQANMEEVWTQLQELLEKRSDLNCPLFMKPTETFGQTVIGVMDPNGYKVILAGKASSKS